MSSEGAAGEVEAVEGSDRSHGDSDGDEACDAFSVSLSLSVAAE